MLMADKSSSLDNALIETTEFYKDNECDGKVMCIDYSSVNLAKYMHIGHLKTTIMGLVMKNICETLGYNTVSINYVGDYGTPFGKMIFAYLTWGNEKELNERKNDLITRAEETLNKAKAEKKAAEVAITTARQRLKSL